MCRSRIWLPVHRREEARGRVRVRVPQVHLCSQRCKQKESLALLPVIAKNLPHLKMLQCTLVPASPMVVLAAGSGGLATTHHSFLSSFSAVSTATIARNGAFFQIFRDLQDFHVFAPLRTQNFEKIHHFCENLANFPKFCKFC